jgi:hypothetical protein
MTVAVRSKAWSLFARSNTGVVGSNPSQDTMSMCVYSVFVLPCVQVAALRLAGTLSELVLVNCVKDQDAKKGAKVQQSSVGP